jgi:hypothetical protein
VQALNDGLARGIPDVQNPREGMGGLPPEIISAVGGPVELHTGLFDKQLLHQTRAFPGENLRGGRQA